MRLTVEQLALLGYDAHGHRLAAASPATGGAGCSSEAPLHEHILARCRALGYYVIHSRMDWPTSVAVGAPDFVIAARDGRVVWIECKTAKGKLTAKQQAHVAWLRALGHDVFVCRSKGEADEALEGTKP
jgi:hypothetical protein